MVKHHPDKINAREAAYLALLASLRAELAKDTKHVLLPSWCRYLRIRSFEGLQKSDDGADFNDLKRLAAP